MVKQNQRIIMVVGRYRIVERTEGVYRLQYKKRFSFSSLIRRRNRWLSIAIDFKNLNRLKVKMYKYESKIAHK